MQSWRRYTIFGVLAFLLGVGVWASMAWTDTVTVVVPKGQPPQSVSFACGHLFGAHEVKPSAAAATLAKPLAHKPCSGRTSRRVLVVVDAAVGVAALFVLLTRFSPRPVDLTPTG
jgi:hypothetical protein